MARAVLNTGGVKILLHHHLIKHSVCDNAFVILCCFSCRSHCALLGLLGVSDVHTKLCSPYAR